MFRSTDSANVVLSDESYCSSRKLAIITGATSGIGRAYAGYFASQGYDLLITGRRKETIKQVASEISACYGVNVDIVIADLSRNDDISRLLQIIDKNKNIEALVNNAGYGMDTKFSEDELESQISMLKVHVNAPIMLTHKVLPVMMSNNKGIIINVSSLAAYMPTAGNTMYTSTKSFLKNFTESLYMDVNCYGIKVQCLCPGFTYSDFHRNLTLSYESAKHGYIHWMSPTDVVEHSIASLNNGHVICIPGFLNRVMVVISMMVPRNLYYLLANKLEQRIRKHPHIDDLAPLRVINSH